MMIYQRQWITVDDMYKYADENNLYLLSMSSSEFWREYVTNHAWFDKKFRNMFKSFRYYLQSEGETVATVTTNFIDDVAFHLWINQKKYDELFRLYSVTDEEMPVSGNVNLTETLQKETSDTGSLTYGEREDSIEETEGARTDTINRSETLGSRNDVEENTVGSQTETSTKKVYAFNSSSYDDDIQNETISGAREDERNITKGSQSNSSGGTDVKGQQVNNRALSKGEQINERNLAGTEEYTKTVKGTNGYVSIIKSAEQFKNFWDKYTFYEYIFKEICRDLLLI